MNFKDYCEITDLLEEFDSSIIKYESLNESTLIDFDIDTVISEGLSGIDSDKVKKVMNVISGIAKFSGKKTRDIMKLFSLEGIQKIKEFISKNIIGSEEIKYILRKFDDNRYKGYKGFEQFIKDMQEDNPKLLDSLKIAVERLLK